jgi:hypothetical protein
MRLYGDSSCKKCCGKGYRVFTVSNVHDRRHADPCPCLTGKIRKSIKKEDIEKYDLKIEKMDGIDRMYITEKTADEKAIDEKIAPSLTSNA